jgi:N-methylhydantoinase A/oxoprolinase/acetone carboxylase beta subunit
VAALPIAYQQAEQALGEPGARLGLSAIETALAMVAIANANISDALKLLTLERGRDSGSMPLTCRRFPR